MFNGLIDEVTAVRDYDYEVVCGSSNTTAYPERFQLDPQTIKDQKSVGECVGCVMATIVEAYYKREFSENWAYGRLRNETHTGEGMIASIAIKNLKELGIIPKEKFDLLLEMPEVREAVEKFPEYDEEAKNYKISGYVKIFNGDTSTGLRKDIEIKDALLNHRLPLFAISRNGFSGGSHAITLLGWNDEKETYIFQNSWGENYGKGGVSEIRKNKVDDVYLFLFEPITIPFTDVSDTDWFKVDVMQCYLSGLIKGKTDTLFDPYAPITRAEACAMFNRLMKKVDTSIGAMNKLISIKHEYNQL